MANEFYWRHARDSLLTDRAIQLFQILSTKEGHSLTEVKDEIDSEYLTVTGRSGEKDLRHGGKIQTAINVYREAGWVTLENDGSNTELIKLTDAGRQALTLLGTLPDFLKAVPYFVAHILARYQLNNPARPSTSKNMVFDAQLAQSDIFPYWTLFKIMRSCKDRITADELRRFVFRLQRHEDITNTIKQIKEYRVDVERDLPEEKLGEKYPPPLQGAIGEPKYIMGRLGTQVGHVPPVISKEGHATYVLSPAYTKFIDQIISKKPTYKDYLSEHAWMSVHGNAIPLTEDFEEAEDEVEQELLPDDDPVWKQFKSLVDHGVNGILLTGPPGTSKTWYASKLALKIAQGQKKRVKYIQFHPSYSYEEFVESYVPTKSPKPNSPAFEVVPKLFLRLCNTARNDPACTYVLVIDEFSRGDPSRVFGEVLTYLENSYRGKPFLLPYSGKTTSIPPNILIIGTMNPYDKSVTNLDDAMERRFTRIAMDPSVNLLRAFLQKNGAEGPFIGRVIQFFNSIVEKSPHGFGHAFFLDVSGPDDLERLWNHNLRFVLEKMFPFEPDIVKQLKDGLEAACNLEEPR